MTHTGVKVRFDRRPTQLKGGKRAIPKPCTQLVELALAVCRAECETFAMRNCAERFARPASTPQAGEMGETSSALTVSAKVFAAYWQPGSHGESFRLTATVCTCQLQAQSRWQAYVYVDISCIHLRKPIYVQVCLFIEVYRVSI